MAIIVLVSFPLYQVMLGVGFPTTGQEIDTGLPSVAAIT